MSLLTRAVGNGRALFRSAPPQFGDSSIPPNSAGYPGAVTGSGMVTKVSGALAISTVLSCLRVLHDDFSTLPFYAYTGAKRGVREMMPNQPRIVVAPFGPDLSPQDGFGQIVMSIKASGNAFLWVAQTDAFGFPTLLAILPPDAVKVKFDGSEKAFQIGQKSYGSERIKQITGMMLPGSVTGIDPLSYQRVLNQLAVDVGQYAANFFQSGGTPGGVLQMEGAGDKEKAREVAQIWEASHAGVNNAHRPGVLFNGKYVPTTVAPENAQFLQTREFLRAEISGWYGVPLARINADNGTGRTPAASGGLEGIDDDYAKHTLLPLAVSIEALWDRLVPGDEGSWTNFDFSGLLRASALSRAQIAQIHRVTAVRNPNEIRADEGWAPYDGGEDYKAPLNSNTSGAPAGNHNDPSVDQGQDGQSTPGVTGGAK